MILQSPVRAGEALGEALHDPTLSNVTNAGVQTAIALGRPAAALAALGGAGLAGSALAYTQELRTLQNFQAGR